MKKSLLASVSLLTFWGCFLTESPESPLYLSVMRERGLFIKIDSGAVETRIDMPLAVRMSDSSDFELRYDNQQGNTLSFEIITKGDLKEHFVRFIPDSTITLDQAGVEQFITSVTLHANRNGKEIASYPLSADYFVVRH